jgi:hypothetical protein
MESEKTQDSVSGIGSGIKLKKQYDNGEIYWSLETVHRGKFGKLLQDVEIIKEKIEHLEIQAIQKEITIELLIDKINKLKK